MPAFGSTTFSSVALLCQRFPVVRGANRLCNAFVGQPFQADQAGPNSMKLGKRRRPRKADLRLRCKAAQTAQRRSPKAGGGLRPMGFVASMVDFDKSRETRTPQRLGTIQSSYFLGTMCTKNRL